MPVGAGFKPALVQQTWAVTCAPIVYEHVIRNEKVLNRLHDYIASNPARWADDPDNISRSAYAEKGRV